MEFLNFIGGERLSSSSQRKTSKISPVTGEADGSLPASDVMDVVRAVQVANKCLATWTKTSREERASLLIKLAEKLEFHAAEIATAVADDIGTPVSQTLEFSIPMSLQTLRAQAESLLIVEPAGTHSGPVGLVALITPASDPLVCLVTRLAPAWAGANAVIIKPSSYTPATATLLAKFTAEAGFPAGTLGLLFGAGNDVGEALIQHPGITTISFQGSTETGRRVNFLVAEALKKVHLSLGAKNPVLLFANADLAVVVPEIVKICAGLYPSRSLQGSRLFIQDAIFKPTLELLKAEFDRIKIGDPFKRETQVGPLPHGKSFRLFNEAVGLARKENGRYLTVGNERERPAGYFVKPVLFADLTNCSTLQQDEILGPLVLASSFKYQHDALKYANVSPYGRMAYIFEPDLEKANRIAMKMETGTVNINASKRFLNLAGEIPLLKNSGNLSEGATALQKFFVRLTASGNEP